MDKVVGLYNNPVSVERQSDPSRVLFWSFLAPLLLILTVAVGLFFTSTFALTATVLTLASLSMFIKKKGWVYPFAILSLSALYLASYSSFSQGAALWQGGLLLSFLLNVVISTIAFSEVQSLLFQKKEELDQERSHTQTLQKDKELCQLEWQNEKLTLQEELKKWKEAAEQRHIEKRRIQEEMALVESEIHLLSEQKSSFIEDAFLARKQAGEMERKLFEASKDWDEWALKKAEIEKESIEAREKFESIRMLHETLSMQKEALEEKNHQLTITLENTQALMAEKIEQIKHLQNLETLEKLESLKIHQESLIAHQASLEEKNKELVLTLENVQTLIAEKSAAMQQLEREVSSREERIKHLEEQMKTLTDEEEIEARETHQKTAKIQGLYQQLRQQFEEKNQVLGQTRSDFYQLETKYLGLLNEQKMDQLLEEERFSFEEGNMLSKELLKLDVQNHSYEEEIKSLEALISRLQSQ